MEQKHHGRVIPLYSLRLRDAFAPRYRIVGACWGCKAKRELDLMALIHRLGPDAFVKDLDGALKCQDCGGKMIELKTEWL